MSRHDRPEHERPLRITILEEIPAESFENGSVEQLGAHAKQVIAKHLERTHA